ncbi:MAG TPA: hypothetical protein VMV59_00795, partial [Candidatus Dormibacteraeota bacterium]|nr:hypothetical protein [Candidatus Dormibacteraeota bacterium]
MIRLEGNGCEFAGGIVVQGPFLFRGVLELFWVLKGVDIFNEAVALLGRDAEPALTESAVKFREGSVAGEAFVAAALEIE